MIEGIKGNVVLHSLFIMFGMSDPNQTLLQLESYIKDGRLEMSEVMATQFTDMFLSMKKNCVFYVMFYWLEIKRLKQSHRLKLFFESEKN
jgi:hypothetical protein